MDESFILLRRLVFSGKIERVSHEIGVLLVILLFGEVVIDVEIESVRDIDSFFVDPFLENEFNLVTYAESLRRFRQIFSNSLVETDEILKELLIVSSIQTAKLVFYDTDIPISMFFHIRPNYGIKKF